MLGSFRPMLKQIWACGKAAANCRLMLPSAISAEMPAHQGWDSTARPGLKAGIFCAHADDALAMIGRSFDFVTAVIDDAPLAAAPTSAGVFL